MLLEIGFLDAEKTNETKLFLSFSKKSNKVMSHLLV